MKSLVSVALIASFAFSSAAFADVESGTPAKPAKDPNRMICKSEEQTGSRLNKKKTCMTATQWEEQRRLSRMEIDRSQANNYKNE
ncbi:MAG: hypothetical protein EOP18_04820 [Rhizobiaceae bacterium]|nr:MAG: hypothetical protein EOP18_04820 [Rhizobiaceae bacterium]